MFDFGIGYTELFVIGVVAIIVIGPKDLPRVLRAVGQTVAKMRGMAREFQGHLDSAMKDAGLDDVKKEIQGLKDIGTIQPVSKKPPVNDTKKAEEDFAKFFGEPEKPAASGPSA
jgi:Tat protein translocase TatB subunit